MLEVRRHAALTIALSVLFLLAPVATAQDFPAAISDQAFWKMVTDFSEPGGYFRSDNFVSNELAYQTVIPTIQTKASPGAYLGVGPDQNFTYIVALEPQIAFIVDIRRQNLLQHLMYKAIIEMSSDRADFLSRLFSRKRPTGIETSSTATELFQAFRNMSPDDKLFVTNLAAIEKQLIGRHGFVLDDSDRQGITYVFKAFFDGGPDVTYSFPDSYVAGRAMPKYSDLMTQTDGYDVNRSYMGTEHNFSVLKEYEVRNLVVPLVGDFGGPKAIRSVGQYLKDHKTTLAALYTSNVEQYLFETDAWLSFYESVKTLPIGPSSTFIRSVFNIIGGQTIPPSTIRSLTLLCPIQIQLDAFDDGRIESYSDVTRMSTLP